MGSAYAGILGSLAFVTVLAHGLLHSAGVQHTLWRATLAMAAFGIVGCVAGLWAAWIVEDAVRGKLADEIAKNSAQSQGAKRPEARSVNPPRAAASVKT